MTTTTTEEVRKYELMVIFSGDLPESSFEKELGEVKKFLKESTKNVSYEESWGKREFAYKIKRQKRGYYVVFAFHADPAQIMEIRTNIKLNPSILRHMLVTLPEEYNPGMYKEEMFVRAQTQEEETAKKKRLAKISPKAETIKSVPTVVAQEAGEKPLVAGKEEEEQLEKVQKKLEAILDNPDIDIK